MTMEKEKCKAQEILCPRTQPSPTLLCLPQLTPGMGSWVWKWVRPRGCGDPCSCRRGRLPAAALLVHLGAVPAATATAAPSPRGGGRSRRWVRAAPSAPRTAPRSARRPVSPSAAGEPRAAPSFLRPLPPPRTLLQERRVPQKATCQSPRAGRDSCSPGWIRDERPPPAQRARQRRPLPGGTQAGSGKRSSGS